MEAGPVLLAILDGWGYTKNDKGNPFLAAKTPTLQYLFNNYPNARLRASEDWVGLPSGQMGNSEVGHMSIGSGRVILQDLPRISSAIKTGELAYNPGLKDFIKKIKHNNNKCHIMGLMSDGGVHSHIDHLIWMANLLASQECEVYVHAFVDGRDTSIISGGKYLERFIKETEQYPNIKLATISGRYYAMDRDRNWDRTELAYNALFFAKGLQFTDYRACFKRHYDDNITDEFFMPSIIGDFKKIENKDAVVVINFRADRVRQLLEAMLLEEFQGFEVKDRPQIFALGMSEYSTILSERMDILFKNANQVNTLGEILERNNMKQLRIAETEKYAHVTFFFNCGKEQALRGEDRVLIKSPIVYTYDLKPEMSAFEVTEALIEKMENYNFILLNFANLDMVGHTGNFQAAIKAIEVIDTCLGKIIKKTKEIGGSALITSDHGNIEVMLNDDGLGHTHHTTNLVPIILMSEKFKSAKISDGTLTDIAPTILDMLGLDKPAEMTGSSLIKLEKV
jgi:2,3-bisphosphoglycerate-independent phosphoglycerate mutase